MAKRKKVKQDNRILQKITYAYKATGISEGQTKTIEGEGWFQILEELGSVSYGYIYAQASYDTVERLHKTYDHEITEWEDITTKIKLLTWKPVHG